MPDTVEPRVARGLRDLLPDQMLARQTMIDTIRGVYESYGFVPLSTPAIEYLDVLSGSAGQEALQSIFSVSNPDEEALGLRFDLTVPLVRVVAQYIDLPRPFLRYQVAPVWRYDKPGLGRFREFTQFDRADRRHRADLESSLRPRLRRRSRLARSLHRSRPRLLHRTGVRSDPHRGAEGGLGVRRRTV